MMPFLVILQIRVARWEVGLVFCCTNFCSVRILPQFLLLELGPYAVSLWVVFRMLD